MARPMTGQETEAFMLEGTRTGKLAWVSQDGKPHVAPVWFLLDGTDVIFMTEADGGKGRALTRTGQASLVVDLEQPPYGFVKVDGTVTVTPNHPDLLQWSTRIGERYMGPERADEFGRRNAVPEEALVRLTPSRVIAMAGLSD